jgi:hypothetical protein
MAKKTKDNPTGSPLGKFSVLNLVVKGVDSLTGYDRSKEYFDKKKPYQKPRKVASSGGGGMDIGKTPKSSPPKVKRVRVRNPDYKDGYGTSTPKFIFKELE